MAAETHRGKRTSRENKTRREAKPAAPLKKIGRKSVVGWQEWAALPGLGIRHIKAKLDTGARSSALHAPRIAVVEKNGAPWVKFDVDDDPPGDGTAMRHSAALSDYRQVRSSSGHTEMRYVVKTMLALAGECWEIELTLTDRSDMELPMLIGRSALRRRMIVDPGRRFLCGEPEGDL